LYVSQFVGMTGDKEIESYHWRGDWVPIRQCYSSREALL